MSSDGERSRERSQAVEAEAVGGGGDSSRTPDDRTPRSDSYAAERRREQSADVSEYHDTLQMPIRAAEEQSQSYESPAPLLPERPTTLDYKQVMVLRGHQRGVAMVKYSPDGRWIASCSADGTIKVWEAQTGKLVNTLEGHLAGISAISWSPDSQIIASGSDDKSIRLWDAINGKPYPILFMGHHNYVYSLAFSPKGNMLVSGSYDEAVFIWDIRTARVLKSLPAHSDPVGGVDFVHDGTLVVSCSTDGLIRIWDTATGQCLRTLVHEDNAGVTSVRFSPNGKYVLAWTHDSSIRLWEYISGRCVKTYQGHLNKKYSLAGAFGTYGGDSGEKYAMIASGSEDGQIVLWDVSSKDVMQKLDGHDGPVLGVDMHPSESMLVSGGLDGTIRVWASARLATSSTASGGGSDNNNNGGQRGSTAMTSAEATAPTTTTTTPAPVAVPEDTISTTTTTADTTNTTTSNSTVTATMAPEDTSAETPGRPTDGPESSGG